MEDNCGSPRRFFAADRSKRVDLAARGSWIAPGTVRMRAYGSELGPLRVLAKIHSTRYMRITNRSRFPVRFTFVVTCHFGD